LTGRAAAGVVAMGGLLDEVVGGPPPVAVAPVGVGVVRPVTRDETAAAPGTGAVVGVRRPEDAVAGVVRVAETGR